MSDPPARSISLIFTAAADPGVADAVRRTSGVHVEEHHRLTREQLPGAAARADLLVPRSFQTIDEEVLAAGAAGRLKAVVQASAGLDNIDAGAAGRLGVRVVSVDPGNAVAVAELTLLSILALHRDAPGHWERTRGGQWPVRDEVDDPEVRDRRIGIVGIGRVGSRVARRAAAFEAEVFAVDPYVPPARFEACGARRVERLEELLALSDVLTLHCPLTAETRGMIDAAALARLPEGAFLVNTARGGIVDETALGAALDRQRIAGAALDVFASEPPPAGGLVSHPRVLPTPHIGGHTHESHRDRARNLIEALRALVEEIGE
jgi:phosphoglycerate dehydrogenase-like enzyme